MCFSAQGSQSETFRSDSASFVALCGRTKGRSLGQQLETHDLDAHPVDLLKISWRQLPTRPQLADPFDMSQLSEDAAVRRLGDRLGFGLSGNALIEAQQRGLTATLKQYLSPADGDSGAEQTPPPQLQWTPRPRNAAGGKPSAEEKKAWRQQMRKQREGLMLWWLDRMVRADDQLRERMTWFWHGHFATSFRKVRVASLMLGQNQTLRRLGLGDFKPIAQAMIIDPAMLVWLDGNDNTAKAPNENLSREFMELFALGQGPYTESDVKQAARALTGWKVNRLNGSAMLRPRLHDAGSKHILGHDGDFDAPSFVQLVVSQPSCASFVISRVWFRLVSSTPPEAAAMARLRGAYEHGIASLLDAMVSEPAFRDAQSSLVKQPVEWAVGLMRALGVRPSELPDKQARHLLGNLRGMGQVPFLPPSAGGWPSGGGWLTTGAALARVQVARLISERATLSSDAARTPTRQRVEYLRRLLGVDHFSTRSADAISQVAGRLPLAITVAACSPEYIVSG
jgi:uncharacterized protein (DUF1800 family)